MDTTTLSRIGSEDDWSKQDKKEAIEVLSKINKSEERRSMDKIVTAKNIGRMWEMLNHGRTYEQKMKEMNKMFGMKEDAINKYLAIFKLSSQVTIARNSSDKMDLNTLAGIGSEDDWSKSEKKDAIEELSKVVKSEERRNLLSEIKKKKSEAGKLKSKSTKDEINVRKEIAKNERDE